MMIRTCLFVAALAFTTLTTAAQKDLAYECEPPILLGHTNGLNHPAAITIEGDYAYIAQEKDNALVIVDLSDPANPAIIAYADDLPVFIDEDTRILVNQSALYIDGSIINIEDKTDPWFMRYGSSASRPIFNGTIFAPTSFQSTLSVTYDASRPYALGLDPLDESVPLQGNPAAMIDGLMVTDQLARWNIDDPLNPVLVEPSSYPTSTQLPHQLRHEPPYIILQTEIKGEPVVHTHNEATDAFTTTELPSLQTNDLTVRADIIYSVSEGLTVSLLADPPMHLATHNNQPALNGARFIRQHNGHFVIVSDFTIAVYDIPTNPVGAARTDLPHAHLELMGDTAILSTGSIDTTVQGASVIDISDPKQPRWIADLPTDEAFGIESIDPFVFVADKSSGLVVFDLTDPANPAFVESYNTSANQSGTPNTRDVYIEGDHAYAVDRNAGLTIYTIADAHDLTPIATLPFGQAAQRVTVQDDLAFVSGLNRLYIVDVSDPFNPEVLSSIDELPNTTQYIHTALKDGHLLYTADSDNGYRIFDISDTTTPVELAHFDADVTTDQGSFEAFVYDLVLDNNRLHVAMSWTGLAVYDNTDPFNPVLLRHAPAALPPLNNVARYRDLEIRDNLLFTAAGDAGMRIYDLTDCAGPCPADLDQDGDLDFFDVSAFLVAFSNSDPLADLQPDGNYNFFDVAQFIALYQNGCP